MNSIDYIYLAIVLYLSGCLVASITRRDGEIRQVWLSWIYVLKFIITWNKKNKRKKSRLGDLGNKDFVILYNYGNRKFSKEFEYIAKKYIKEYGNRLQDAYVYANYDNTEPLISVVRNDLRAMELPGNILEIFKAYWLSYKYDKSLNVYLANNDFSVDGLIDFTNSSLGDIQFSEAKLFTGSSNLVGLALISNKIKGGSLLITVNNLDIRYEII